MEKPTALLAESEDVSLGRMATQLERHDFEVMRCDTLRDANRRLDRAIPALAVVAVDLPDGDGMSLLAHPALQNTRAVILTGHNYDPERIRNGMAAGASYFLCDPARERLLGDLLDDLVAEFREAQPAHRDSGQRIDRFGPLLGSSAAMHKLYRTLRKVASVNASVLLVGERGTGKRLAAWTIHCLSDRRAGPFVECDCATGALEKDLFGSAGEPGYLKLADGGTLFLRNITAMPNEMQARLLAALEDNGLGNGATPSGTDARLVATTHRDPQEAINLGHLRKDLYLRLSAFPVRVPPLRERGNDVPGLAEWFVAQVNERAEEIKYLSQDAADMLTSYNWPGNVRELRNTVEHACIAAERDIAPEHLPNFADQPAPEGGDVLQLNIGESVQDAEKKLTLATLTFYNGDKRKAAQTLGVSLKTLYNRINAYQADKQGEVSRAAE